MCARSVARLEIREDFLQLFPHRGEAEAAELEELRRPLHIGDEIVHVDVIGAETGMDRPQLVEGGAVGERLIGPPSTETRTVPSLSLTMRTSPVFT